jgi:DNA polymerase III sliding clamp (beta) subunit (PCNA family)
LGTILIMNTVNNDLNKYLCTIDIDYLILNKNLNDVKSISDASGYFTIQITTKGINIFLEDLTSSLCISLEYKKIFLLKDTEEKEINNDFNFIFRVKSQVLSSLIKNLSCKNTVRLNIHENQMVIESGKSSFTLYITSFNGKLMEIKQNDNNVKIDAKILLQSIKSISFATAKENIEDFNGVFFYIKDNYLTTIGADKSRLSVYSSLLINNDTIINTKKVFLKKKCTNSIQKLLGLYTGTCVFQITESSIDFFFKNIVYTSGIGSFKETFNLQDILSEKRVLSKFSIKKNILKEIISRINILNNNLTYYVSLYIKDSDLFLSVYDPNNGFFKEQAHIEVEQEVDNSEIKINTKYLSESVQHTEEEDIFFTIQSNGPCILKSGNITHCIMPIRGI